MTEQSSDLQVIFEKLAELQEQVSQEQKDMDRDVIQEYDEIRALREIVMEVESKPQVYFSTT